jgi:hypothetical protein
MKRGKYYERKRAPKPLAPVFTGEEPCRSAPDIFHPERGSLTDVYNARLLCSRCPSRDMCLEWALSDPSLQGIHAGTSYRQRQMMRLGR